MRSYQADGLKHNARSTARHAILGLALCTVSALSSAADPSKNPSLSGLPPLPKGAKVVAVGSLDGNCGANNQRDEPVEIKTNTPIDCQKWLAAVAAAYKHWPSESTRALNAIGAEPNESHGHRLYAVAQCYSLPRFGEHCAVVHATNPYGEPFESLKSCQTFIVKYLASEVPQNGKFQLDGGNWYECVSRPDDRWQTP